jgi:hypothetical protein
MNETPQETPQETPWSRKQKTPPTLHDHLWNVCKTLPSDFEPYGKRKRDEVVNGEDLWHQDCSCGCKFFKPLEGQEGNDWGVCWNPNSPRNGLLTFEHQGCPAFEYDQSYSEGNKMDGDQGEEHDLNTSPLNPPTSESNPI